MRISLNNILVLLLITVTGLAGSLITGLMSYGGAVFNAGSPGFSFLAYGLSGAFIFAFYHVRGLSETITTAVIVSAIQFAISSTWITVLNAGIWSFGVNLPVVTLAFLFERKLAGLRQAKFVVVGVVYGAMFVLLTLVAGALASVEQMPAVVFRQNFIDGLLIGVGLGIGIEGGEAFVYSFEHHRSEKSAGPKKESRVVIEAHTQPGVAESPDEKPHAN